MILFHGDVRAGFEADFRDLREPFPQIFRPVGLPAGPRLRVLFGEVHGKDDAVPARGGQLPVSQQPVAEKAVGVDPPVWIELLARTKSFSRIPFTFPQRPEPFRPVFGVADLAELVVRGGGSRPRIPGGAGEGGSWRTRRSISRWVRMKTDAVSRFRVRRFHRYRDGREDSSNRFVMRADPGLQFRGPARRGRSLPRPDDCSEYWRPGWRQAR